MIKNRKEFKLHNNWQNFKVLSGTIDKINPSVVYIKFNTWATYLGSAKNYKENVGILNSNIKNKLKSELRGHKMFDVSFIYTPEIKKIFLPNKSTFHISFEFTLKQRLPINTNMEEIRNEIENLSSIIINSIERSTYFKFNKTKNINSTNID